MKLELYSKNLMNGISKTVAIMKKLMKLFVLVAAAAMALASCQKNEIDGLVKQEAHFTINAGIAETKTIITDNGDGTYTPSWTGDEQLGVLFSAPNAETKTTDVVTFDNASEAGETASFQGSTTVTENGTFYSFYPASVFNRGYSEGDARLDLKNVQKPSATSFDQSCDILVAKPYEYEVVDGQVVVKELYFKRLMSVLRIDLNTDFEDVKNEFVESVSFTAGDIKIVGYARVFLDNPDFTTQNWASSGDEYCTVTAKYDTDVVSVAGAANSVYMVIAPVTIPKGKELTFEIKTKNYTISKTVTVPDEMKFAAGNVNKINLTIKEDNCTAKADDTSDYSGTYAILAKRTSGGYYYMTNDLGTASTKRFTAETAGDALPEAGVTLGASKLWEVSKSGEYYTVQSVGAEKYITWTSGNSANLGDEGIKFTIEKSDDGTYQLSYSASDATRYLSLNGTSGNDYFALYKSGQAMDLSLIPAERGEEPSTLTATAPMQISAEGGDGSFSYTLTNPKDGVELTVTEDAEWITNAVAAEGTVTYTIAANESEDTREAVITLTYGDLTENVSVSQAGKPAEGGDDDLREYTVTYTVNSSTAVIVSGNAPEGASATFQNTYGNNKEQMTAGNSQTYTLSGYKGCIIKSVTLSMKSNASKGAGTLSLKAGTTDLASISSATNFNKWYDNTSFGSTYRDVHVQMINTDYVIGDENVVLVLAGTTNSIYCQSVTITYLSGGNNGGETPDPTPDPEEPENPDTPDTPETGEPTTITMTTFSATNASMDSNVSYTTAKGGGTSNPAINGGEIRLYQNSAGTGGGSITITAANGYKLSSVTVGSSMATSVAYTIGSDTTKSANASLAANGKYTVNDINDSSITFYCMGTSSSSRLYVNYLSATYEVQ